MKHGPGLAGDDEAEPVEKVGQGAANRAGDERREKIAEGDDAEPGTGFREFPGKPADGEPLHPVADQRDSIADDEDAEIVVAEHTADAAGCWGCCHGRIAPG